MFSWRRVCDPLEMPIYARIQTVDPGTTFSSRDDKDAFLKNLLCPVQIGAVMQLAAKEHFYFFRPFWIKVGSFI